MTWVRIPAGAPIVINMTEKNVHCNPISKLFFVSDINNTKFKNDDSIVRYLGRLIVTKEPDHYALNKPEMMDYLNDIHSDMKNSGSSDIGNTRKMLKNVESF